LELAKFGKIIVWFPRLLLMLNAEHISDVVVVFVNLMHSFPAPLWLFRADFTFTLVRFK